MSSRERIVVCTRGSALALAQARAVVAAGKAAMPGVDFHVEVVRTTGDKLQTAALAQPGTAGESLPKGLFTKELETVLLDGSADVAVHSLKDLPTELPEGLVLAATLPRADVRDVLLYRGADAAASRAPAPAEWRPGARPCWHGGPGVTLDRLPEGACIATSSPRRAAQVRASRPDATVVPIRGNVGTRLQRLADEATYDAILLAAAGLGRLGLFAAPGSRLTLDPRLPRGHAVPPPPAGLRITVLDEAVMVPAVGQGAVALEIRGEPRPIVRELCAHLNHRNTFSAITAERSFLEAMGGGCQSPVGAYARVVGHELWLRAVSFQGGDVRRGEARLPVAQAVALGRELAARLR